MNIILLGAPGSGKGTEGALISKYYNIPAISTGDIIRENIAKKTPNGKLFEQLTNNGQLVPDELVVDLVKERLKADDVKNGFIFDGFPRTVNQAEMLKSFTNIDSVILIDVDKEVILNRILSRRVCPSCKAVYSTTTYSKDICEKCHTPLVQREDDNEETVLKRYTVYNSQTAPLVDYYRSAGLLKTVDGNKTPQEVFEEIKSVLKG